jgi:dihydrofolate synthase/folylpolyglutamate synthase
VQSISNFSEANKYLSRFYDNSRTVYTLDNMRELMEFLGNPQNKLRVVHVAGTSGKTSTAYYVSALLAAGGYSVGLTISPHVDQLNERVQINNQPIAENEFCDALTNFLELIEKSSVKPSWFEAVVAFAYWYFAQQKVNYAVVEVGLGGLKDGTNVVNRTDKVCAITDIGLDHTGILGDNLAEIAEQKAGIIGNRNTVFSYEQSKEVMKVLQAISEKQHANLMQVTEPEIVASLIPRYQQRNWSLAYAVYKFIQDRDNLRHLTSQVLQETKHTAIPGRMEIRHIGNKTIIMDGAHNAQKMTAFLASFTKLYPDAKPTILLGVKAGKEYQEIIPLLKPIAGKIFTTSFKSSQDLPIKSMDPDKLAHAFGDKALTQSIPDQREAYRALVDDTSSIGIITGSFYLLGQIRKNEDLA